MLMITKLRKIMFHNYYPVATTSNPSIHPFFQFREAVGQEPMSAVIEQQAACTGHQSIAELNQSNRQPFKLTCWDGLLHWGWLLFNDLRVKNTIVWVCYVFGRPGFILFSFFSLRHLSGRPVGFPVSWRADRCTCFSSTHHTCNI